MVAYRLIDPNERLDFSLNWSDFLDDSGSPSDTIVSSVWSVTPQEASPTIPLLTDNGFTVAVTSVFIEDCRRAEVYLLTNRITTACGRTADRSVTIRCQTR
jgi:hypothetical protein